VYKIDGVTGLISVFATLPQKTNAGVSAALGNINFDCVHTNFYVSDMANGKIYRLNRSGAILSSWDHGLALLPTIVDNTNTFTPLGRRVWAVQAHNGRLFYGVWWEDQGRQDPAHTNQVWSVGLAANGDFVAGTDQLEISLPPIDSRDFSSPPSDISFGPAGTMLIGERSMSDDTNPGAHQSAALEYTLVGTTWTLPNPSKFQISSIYPPGSCAGGVDYDWSPGGLVWVMGDALHVNGGPPDPNVYGLQGLPYSGGAVTNSVLIDLDGDVINQAKTQLGDVEIPCVPGCLAVKDEKVECVTNGVYSYSFTLVNQFPGPINWWRSWICRPMWSSRRT